MLSRRWHDELVPVSAMLESHRFGTGTRSLPNSRTGSQWKRTATVMISRSSLALSTT